MKKLLIVSLVAFSLFLATGAASAHGTYGFSFGFFFAPPVVIAPPAYYPPAYYYPPPSYPPPVAYAPREWVPSYWRGYWGPYGWQRVWVPGHWRYYR